MESAEDEPTSAVRLEDAAGRRAGTDCIAPGVNSIDLPELPPPPPQAVAQAVSTATSGSERTPWRREPRDAVCMRALLILGGSARPDEDTPAGATSKFCGRARPRRA